MISNIIGLSEYESQQAYAAVNEQIVDKDDLQNIFLCLLPEWDQFRITDLDGPDQFFFAPRTIAKYLLVRTKYSIAAISFYMGKDDGTQISTFEASIKIAKKSFQAWRSNPLNIKKQFAVLFNPSESLDLKMILSEAQQIPLNEVLNFDTTIVTPNSLHQANNSEAVLHYKHESMSFGPWAFLGVNKNDPLYVITLQFGNQAVSHISRDSKVLKILDRS